MEKISQTAIPGLLHIQLQVHADDRGSFSEVWQSQRMEEAGLTSLKPVQYNVSHSKRGVIRGIHAEPWQKYIHVAHGTVFAALVDLRKELPSFGQVVTFELDPTQAIFLPPGVGNSFQATSEEVTYTYLVTDFWQGESPYPAVAFNDPDLAIPWPIVGEQQIVSEKDQKNPFFKQAFPN